MHKWLVVVSVMGVVLFEQAAAGQALDDLASRKDFKAYRASSADPTGKNGDARSIAPGATLTLADVKGKGRFTHLWITIAAESPDHLRELVLKMTWDDAATPAVECPVGDFFVQGPGKYVEFQSAPVSVGGSKALNCYWPMPFDRHAVITVTNEGDKQVDAFYYNFDYRLEDEKSGATAAEAKDGAKARAQEPTRYFHTQYRNEFPAPKGKPLTICEAKG